MRSLGSKVLILVLLLSLLLQTDRLLRSACPSHEFGNSYGMQIDMAYSDMEIHFLGAYLCTLLI